MTGYIGYMTIGTNDFDKALGFYDTLLEPMGGKRAFETPSGHLYSFEQGTLLGVFKPADGERATNGNGTMVALKVPTEDQVQEIYAKALELGGTDEGAPGPRGTRGFYAAYFRDLDGNKLCVYHM